MIGEPFNSCEQIIAFEPMQSEPDWRTLPFSRELIQPAFIVAQDPAVEPFQTAEDLARAYGNERVCVLIPGRRFDHAGTRHGRGGGWYDRFLSRAPRSWVRIGVFFPEQWSGGLLSKEAWDESVDFLAIATGSTWSVFPAERPST